MKKKKFSDRIFTLIYLCSLPLYHKIRYIFSILLFNFKKRSTFKTVHTINSPLHISLLCPTRERPKHIKRLTESVYRTASIPERVEVLFYIDTDDNCKEEYKRFFLAANKKFKRLKRCYGIIKDPIGISKSWNVLAGESKGALLIMANDDQVYVDYGWDRQLDYEMRRYPDQIFCMYFNDGTFGERHCAFPIVSRKWFDVLGYFTPSNFEYSFNDTWIEDIAKRIGRLHYISNILVDHMHCEFNKALSDKTHLRYKIGALKGCYWRDRSLFHDTYLERELAAKKLKQAIDNYKDSSS